MNCPQCGRAIPSEAQFCIYCRARIAPQAPEQHVRPATGPTVRLGREAVPPAPQSVPTTPPVYFPAPQGAGGYGRGRGRRGGVGIFPIGMLILFVTGWWWPGILVLFGITALLDRVGGGRYRSGIPALIFFLALALLFSTHQFGNMWFFWPFLWMLPASLWWFSRH
ncbi:MAG: zinc ribbon domain-containing protein [Herpetosiphonaceae bacterium]|nr:zinc ribbon domain-containing protein [Herpetosiphonaceae bacterium]